MRRSCFVGFLLAGLFTVAPAAAQHTAVRLVHGESLRAPTRRVRRILRHSALAPAARRECDPSEGATCVRRLLVGTHADRLLFVRVVWRRRGCVARRDAAGRVVSRRMMRGPSLQLELYDDRGHLEQQTVHDLDASSDAELRRAVSQLVDPSQD